MRGHAKRLAAIETAQPHNRPRLVCIKATMGEAWCADELMRAAGVDPRPADTVVVIRKPAGTGGDDRVLSINGEDLG